MFKLSFQLIILFLFSSCIFWACSKDSKIPATEIHTCEAGPGGLVEISAYVYHYDSLVPKANIYIKYNTLQFPGHDISVYDTLRLCGITGHGRGHAHIKNMRCGDYFLFATGYDSTATDSVFGGMPVAIVQDTGAVHLDIPVF